MFKRLLFRMMIIALILVTSGGYLYSKEYQNPAQMDTNVTYIITTTDNEVNIGRFLDQDSISIRIITEKRLLITIPKKDILTIEIFDKSSSVIPKIRTNSELWFENPHACRYFISSSAFTLTKGHSTYQNTFLVINSFNFGVSDIFSMSTGFELFSPIIFLMGGDFNPIVYISPKWSGKVNDDFHFAAGIFYANPIFDLFSFDSGISYIYGMGTYGSPNNNASISLGWAGAPLLTLSGQARLSEHFSLVTENWFIITQGNNLNGLSTSSYYKNTINNGIFSYGLRFFGERFTLDFALMNNPEVFKDSPIGYPYFDILVYTR